jgi:hypothetical protein
MGTVIFKTENAVFEFIRKDAKERLNILTTEHDAEEVTKLLELISTPGEKTILTAEEHDYFGYLAVDLIGSGKGSVKCKVCGKTYKANQLKQIAIGHGESPFVINTRKKGGIKSLFRVKQKQPAMFGGKGYECPEGHELISMITWRT